MNELSGNYGAAPLCESERNSSAPFFRGKRLRRRGPRSQTAILRRSLPKDKRCRALPGISPGEAGDLMPVNNICNQSHQGNSVNNDTHILHESAASANHSLHGVSVYLVNIRSVIAHLTELCFHLETHRPHVVCIQETWLDQTVKNITVPGYEIVSRRDRKDTANRGGVLTLRREDYNGLVHISNSSSEERSWHFLKLGLETVLLGNWYRPGASDFDEFSELYGEMSEFFDQISGVLLLGDLNIHHKRWLRFSSGDTAVGAHFKTLCEFYGMSQLVREPTRGEYLLI